MEKLFLIIHLLFVFFYSFSQTNLLNANVHLSGRHCRGVSSQPCSIDFPQKINSNNFNSIIYINNKKELIVKLLTKKINSKTKQKLLYKHNKTYTTPLKYELKDIYYLNNKLRFKLNLPYNIIKIPKGIYPLIQKKDTIIITFKLN